MAHKRKNLFIKNILSERSFSGILCEEGSKILNPFHETCGKGARGFEPGLALRISRV